VKEINVGKEQFKKSGEKLSDVERIQENVGKEI
jgi:hypothetical protein